jgi:hypothetical protein
MIYLLLYVDIVLTASSSALPQKTITSLQREFAMKDLGPLHHFMGVTMERWPEGLFLHQQTYRKDAINRTSMAG